MNLDQYGGRANAEREQPPGRRLDAPSTNTQEHFHGDTSAGAGIFRVTLTKSTDGDTGCWHSWVINRAVSHSYCDGLEFHH